jgi:hypothetical protein
MNLQRRFSITATSTAILFMRGVGAAALAVGLAAHVQATVLVFQTDPAIVNAINVPPEYGGNVNSSSGVLSDGNTWLSQQGSGFTPQVGVAYDILTAAGGGGTSDSTHVQSYTNSGDLGVAAYAPVPFAHDTTEIDLTPQSGYEVVLNSFDLVSYANGAYMNQPVRVYDANYTLLTDFGGPQLVMSAHSHFAPNLSSKGMLRLQYGDNLDVGINNVNFDQFAVPEPSGLTIGLGAVAALALKLSRKPSRSRDSSSC